METGPGDQRHIGATATGSARDGVPRLAAGTVGDIAHRVDGLDGRPGGDHNMLALKVLLHAKNLERARNDGSRVGQTAASHIATCQVSLIGLDEHGAADAELADVVAGGSRLVHVHVHGRLPTRAARYTPGPWW